MHRCIKCGAEFRENLEDIILNGCTECGSKFFEYHMEGMGEEAQKDSVETIMVKGHGRYEVNLSTLLEKESIIVSDEEGKYIIDINFLLKKKVKEDNLK